MLARNEYWIIYGLPLITMFVVIWRVAQSRVEIIGESTHESPQASLLTVAYIYFYFLHNFRVLKQGSIDENPHRSTAAPWLWYCDDTQTPTVTSFWPIVMRTFSSRSLGSSRRRQVDYHSLIIDNYSRRFLGVFPHFIMDVITYPCWDQN